MYFSLFLAVREVLVKTVIALQIEQFKSKRSKIGTVVGFAWQGQILKKSAKSVSYWQFYSTLKLT